MSEQKPRDRRQIRRLPAAELSVEWRPRKGLFNRFRPASGQDFTRNGLSLTIEANEALQINDEIELRIELLMEAGSLHLDKVAAVVRNIHEPRSGRPHYGLAFDFDANRHMKSDEIKAQLGRIEGILERSEKLKLRIQPLEEIDSLRN
jgi:hypothetical protein